MYQLYYQPEGVWFGDCMPFCWQGEFYLYHQRDTRRPAPFGEPFGWALTTTRDFVHYRDWGDSLRRGGDDEQDQFIFAGSVFRAEGKFHAFYTGFNRTYPKLGKPSQVLMHAVSENLRDWKKSSEKLLLLPQKGYDPNDWRDPYVFWEEERQRYGLILGTRKLDGDQILRGCFVKFTSKDLEHWDFQGDFWCPQLYSMHEMPDLFRIGEWWYLVYSEYSDKNAMHYRMSKSLEGPWIAPVDDALDGRAYYAGRTASDGSQRILFGWVPTREKNDDRENWEWGGTFVPHAVYQRPDASLGVEPVESLWNAFAGPQIRLDSFRLQAEGASAQKILCEHTGSLMRLEMKISVGAGTRAFGIRLFQNPETGECYEFQCLIGEKRLLFDKVPDLPWFQCMNKGLERPISWKTDTEYTLQIILDGDIATLYVDGTALNVRMCRKPGDQLSLSVADGSLEIRRVEVALRLKESGESETQS